MLRSLILFVALASMLAGAPLNACAADTVTVITTEWPPYIGENIPHKGYAAEVVRSAFAVSGITTRFVFMPWARGLSLIETGRNVVIGPEYARPDMDETCEMSLPFPGGPLVLLGRKNDSTPAIYGSLAELAQLRIGVVRGYSNGPTFDAATYLQRDYADTDASNLRKLLGGRVDLIVADMYVAYYLADHTAGASPRQIRPLAPPLELAMPLHMCFSKRNPDHTTMLRAFNAGLTSMMHDGTLERLYQNFKARHGVHAPQFSD